jgi:hypothetical protein
MQAPREQPRLVAMRLSCVARIKAADLSPASDGEHFDSCIITLKINMLRSIVTYHCDTDELDV